MYCRSRHQQDQLLREAQDQAFCESLEADQEKERKRREGEKRKEEEREQQREREREERQREEVGPASDPAHVPTAVFYFPSPQPPDSPGAGGEEGSMCEPSSSRARGGRPRDAANTRGRAAREMVSASDKLQVSHVGDWEFHRLIIFISELQRTILLHFSSPSPHMHAVNTHEPSSSTYIIQ